MNDTISRDFFSLTPERVLDAIEHSGRHTTGAVYALGSLENRVYDVELEDRSRVIGKFYRPGRWGRETILDEHQLLQALAEAEIPVCAPLPFPDGTTLHETPEGISFALFPRVGGRHPEELSIEEYEQVGRLLARIHNVAASLDLSHRPAITPETYGVECLQTILELSSMAEGTRHRYQGSAERLIEIGRQRYSGIDCSHVVHGDCHRANLLQDRGVFFFLDFDDMAFAPPSQDLWLLLPSRPADCPELVDVLVEGYEQFRPFDHRTLRLVEVLRGLRYIRYAAWIAARWDDPAFQRAFPQFGTDSYWEAQFVDVDEQVRLLEREESD
jgi:Ser/Thr protein kinase RdoA (MazF antagonist)